MYRSSSSEVFLVKGVLNICSKFTGEHPCRSVILIKLYCKFIEIALRSGCSPVNLLDIFRTPSPKNTYGRLLLEIILKTLLSISRKQIITLIIIINRIPPFRSLWLGKPSNNACIRHLNIFSAFAGSVSTISYNKLEKYISW